MGFLWWGRNRPTAKHRGRQRKTWLDRQASQADTLLDKAKETSPVLQAAIIRRATGIPIEAKDIHVSTPDEAFEAKLMVKAIDHIEGDTAFMDDAVAAMIDRIRYSTPQKNRRGGRYPNYPPSNGDGYEEYPPGFWPGMTGDPEEIIEKYHRIRDSMKQDSGGISSLMDTKAASELIKGVFSMITGGKNGGAPEGPQMISVEIDGRFVEMTRDGYEIYKRQRAQLLQGRPPSASLPAAPAAAPAPPPPPGAAPAGTPPPGAATPAPSIVIKPAESDTKPPEVDTKTPETVTAPPPLPPEVVRLFKEVGSRLVDAMEKDKLTPEDFAQKLCDDAKIDNQTMFIFGFLSELDGFDDAVNKLNALRTSPELVPYIDKIVNNRAWYEPALNKIKELAE